jgi:PPE family
MDDRQVPTPAARYESYTHEAMAAEVAAGNDPAAAGGIGGQWGALAEQLQQAKQGLTGVSSASQEQWTGEAGDAVRDALTKATTWLDHAAGVSSSVGSSVSEQAAVAARARADMPPPVPYDPGAMIRTAVLSGDLGRLVGLSGAMSARRAESEAARIKAIDVMAVRDVSVAALALKEPFVAPPALVSS